METVVSITSLVIACALLSLPLALIVQLLVRVLEKFRPLYGLSYPATFVSLLLSMAASAVVGVPFALGGFHMNWLEPTILVVGVVASVLVFRRMVKHHDGASIRWLTAIIIAIATVGGQSVIWLGMTELFKHV